ncbi:MAG: glycosyltransferase [Bacillota bacterium]|jgi:putative colanic acid biosynthesis glycosyltransferase
MRVLQINSVCGTGSTGRVVVGIDQVLREQGHESYIGYGRGFAKNHNAIRIGSSLDNYVHAAVTRVSDRHGFGSRRATKVFIDKVDNLNPDVIHLHNIHGYYIHVGLLFEFIKKRQKPVIWTLHDCWAFTGHCAYFDYAACERWQTECYSCPEKRSYPASLLIDNSRNNFSSKKGVFRGTENLTMVTPSKWLKGLLERSFLSDYPVEVINNGIDLGAFRPTSSNFRKDQALLGKFIILGVANVWDRRKGYHYFVRLSSMLAKDEIIVLVGVTEQQKKRLPANIVGVTRTDSVEELAAIYSTADVFVNPTLEDNFPTTNLEALACGLPVITFETGGSVECIDASCGFVVEKGYIHELYDAIRVMRREWRDKESLRWRCVSRAAMLYDRNDRFLEYVQLYQQKLACL